MYFSKFVLRRCAIRSFPGKPAGQRVGRVPDHSSKSRGRARRGCTESRNAQRKPNTRRPAMLSRHRSGKCQKRGASRRVIERIAGCTCRTTAAVVRITVGPTESVFLMVRSPDLALCLKALLLGIATSHRSSSSSSSNGIESFESRCILFRRPRASHRPAVRFASLRSAPHTQKPTTNKNAPTRDSGPGGHRCQRRIPTPGAPGPGTRTCRGFPAAAAACRNRDRARAGPPIDPPADRWHRSGRFPSLPGLASSTGGLRRWDSFRPVPEGPGPCAVRPRRSGPGAG
mmetsp:Transcript_23331/g.49686  ORF Transcript_23331/g.49686 Transcript_23331/m.49686 type:complete len:286 (-) Transcript_23331:172-1029(-)